MSSAKKIRIRKVLSDGKLRLRREILFLNVIDATDVKVEERSTIYWINESEDVESIENIKLDDPSVEDEIFSEKPHNRGDGVWIAVIKSDASKRGKGKSVEYKYTIYWRDRSRNPQEYDPKLVIKPSAGGPGVPRIGSMEWPLVLFSGFAFLIQWRRKRMAEKGQQSVIE